MAKIEWHPGELQPRFGFVVTNLKRSAERVMAFYNRRGTAEQWIMEGKHTIKWTRLSCQRFRVNEVRLQLHALADNLANFMRILALPKEVERWSLTTIREKLVKIGAKIVAYDRYVTFQMAEVAVSVTHVRANPHSDRPAAGAAGAGVSDADIIEVKIPGEVCVGDGKTEEGRDESGYVCGLKGGINVSSQPINVEIAVEGQDGYHHRWK